MIITFIIGFLIGTYLYLTYWAVEFNPEADVVNASNEFTIVSESYGGCRSLCPSFQVLKDGSYRYIHESSAGQELVLSEGTLPLSLQKELKRNLSAEGLALQSRDINQIECRSFTDGIDVKYRVTLNGFEYKLDSCTTSVNRDTPSWLVLAKVWSYLQTEGVKN